MKNRNVGFLIVGLAVVIVALVLFFNAGLRSIVSETCSHGPTCTMYDTISLQTYLSLAIAGIVLLIGLFFIFAKENEKVVVKTIKEKARTKKLDLSGLDKDEKEVVRILQEENGAVFQSSLMEMMGIGKVKMTRLMDKLEAKQLVERKRRGMNNIIVLKQ
jgi:uncharacterized membrane protein